MPVTGSWCEGALECMYTDRYLARCSEDEWVITPLCTGCGFPSIERCADPFTGTLAGASLSVGPSGTRRPYAEGEVVQPVWGPQGSPMFPYSVRVDGADDPPECIEIDGEIAFGHPGGPSTSIGARPVRLRCGASREAYVVLPFLPCDGIEYPTTMTLRAAGVGETTITVLLGDQGCPDER